MHESCCTCAWWDAEKGTGELAKGGTCGLLKAETDSEFKCNNWAASFGTISIGSIKVNWKNLVDAFMGVKKDGKEKGS